MFTNDTRNVHYTTRKLVILFAAISSISSPCTFVTRVLGIGVSDLGLQLLAIIPANQAYGAGDRSCLGIIRLAKAHSAERVEAVEARALACDRIPYGSMNSILKNGPDQVPLSNEAPPESMPVHASVRDLGHFR